MRPRPRRGSQQFLIRRRKLVQVGSMVTPCLVDGCVQLEMNLVIPADKTGGQVLAKILPGQPTGEPIRQAQVRGNLIRGDDQRLGQRRGIDQQTIGIRHGDNIHIAGYPHDQPVGHQRRPPHK